MKFIGSLRNICLNNVQKPFQWFSQYKSIQQIDYEQNIHLKKVLLLCILTCLSYPEAIAQQETKLSLSKVLEIASNNNRSIQKGKLEKQLAHENIHEQKEEKLPEIGFHAAYARITDLTEYRKGFLRDKVVTETIPVIADITTAANLPLYTGGRIKYNIKKAEQEYEVANLKLEEVTNDTHIAVIATFLRGITKINFRKH
jgi:outer membrane protein